MFDNKRVMAGLADIGKYLEDFNRNLRFITCFYREDSIILFPHKFTQFFFIIYAEYLLKTMPV